MLSLLLATLLTGCLLLSYMGYHLTLLLFLFLQRLVGVLIIFTTLVLALINLILVLLNVCFSVIPKPEKWYHCYNPALKQYFNSANFTISKSTPYFSHIGSPTDCDLYHYHHLFHFLRCMTYDHPPMLIHLLSWIPCHRLIQTH
jgi:hypothetical protein